MESIHILLRLGYTRVPTKSDKIFHESIQKAFKVFGQSSYSDFMQQITSKTGMSETELIKNFHLFEDALKKLTGSVSAKIMMDVIKEELIKYTHLKSTAHKTDEIISKVNEYGVYDFLINTPSAEHILVLYKHVETIDLVLSDFFSKRTQAPFGLVSEFPTKIKDIRNITYEVLSGLYQKDMLPISDTFKIRSGPDMIKKTPSKIEMDMKKTVQKLSDWINNMHSCNISGYLTRFADHDGTWYIRNDLGAEHLKLESSFGVKPYQQIILLCAYDVSKIPSDDLRSLIKSHGYVIVENKSLELYRAPEVN